MHGQGNYTIQVGQDPYLRPPAFQQHPAASTTPATSHYGSPAPQPQVIQQGRPSFHLRPGMYQHPLPSVQHQGPPAPVVTGGFNSSLSYLPLRPPSISTQISHSYPSSEQRPSLWSQNVHQLPPAAPVPGPSAYQLPPSQGYTLEGGPSNQPPSRAPTPPLPPYSSIRQSLVPVLPPPPPPPPPPLPPSSPPGVPPLPPSLPPSDILPKGDGGPSLNGLVDGKSLMMEGPAKDRSVHELDILAQHTEKSGLKVRSEDAIVAHSPTDSDMDMEDDITHPDEERKNCFSTNTNDECISTSRDDYAKEQPQHLQHAGGHRLPEIALHGNRLFAEASVSTTQRGGSETASDCNFHVSMKVSSEADDSGMSGNGQTERPLDVIVEESPSQNKNMSEPSMPVLSSETGYGKLSAQGMEGANSFKLLQGYSSDNTSGNEEENLQRNVGSRSAYGGSTNAATEKGRDFRSELRDEILSESSEDILPKSIIESPRNATQADKLSFATKIVEEISDRSHRGQEPVSSCTVVCQPKDSRNFHDNTGLEGANLHKSDMKSNSNKLNIDEFGRLVREGVSDSDTSDSPHYTRRHARRARKRSRSQSRSRSPHDRRRRRRRSPWRRKERRSLSRSLSPKRRRSRSRSPVLRRDNEFRGDKLRRERGQLPECFDFLRGKCYRGATCRYSHHESEKSERSRYNRGRQHYRDVPFSLQSPDFHEESKVLPDKEMKDKGLKLPQEMPVSGEAKDAKRWPVDSTTKSPSKLDSVESGSRLVSDAVKSNHSGYSAQYIPSGKDMPLVPESAVQYSKEILETFDQQGKRTDCALASESSTPSQALAATSIHDHADRSVGSPITKHYSSEEGPSQSLKELLPSNATYPSQLTISLPSASQAVTASFAQPIAQDYNLKPPILWNHLTPENYSPYQASAAYQHSHFPGPLKSLSSSFLPPPQPPPPLPTGEHSYSSQHMQQSLMPPWNGLSSYTSMRAQPTELPNRSQSGQYQAYPSAREPDPMLHSTDGFGSSTLHVGNLTSRQGGPHIMGEDRSTGHPVQGMNHSLAQAQSTSLLMQSSLKGMHGSVGGGLPADSNSHYRPYFQQVSYGLQYSRSGGVVPVQPAEPGTVGSSVSRITPDFLERSQSSYVRDSVESRIPNYFNSYASNLPPSSKFGSNPLVQANDTSINTKYGVPVGLSTAPVDAQKIGSLGSRNFSVLPRPGGDQYDPLFDSIEPASNSFSKADHQKHETTGDSEDVLKFGGSGRALNMEVIKPEGGTAASANDSLEHEEYGETADVAVDAVLNGTPSSPNDATDVNAGEIEIDQVKTSGKKKKSKEKSMKLFKISIATFVKEVLKPSWRQGNMSKEAFKTIVKKTVDKVSGAMKSHQIPKSQAKINHYIDSSRGKLTKLVMGYVDKYVKV